jgi:hypothetical protein
MHASSLNVGACVLLVLTLIVPVGCGPSTSEPESREELAITQVGRIFHMRKRTQKTPPQGIKDIEGLKGVAPAAVEAIKSKEVIVYWGVGLDEGSDGASTVLAYQKDVPEKGGEVLMQDGTAKKMTADEFKAAKKPADGKLEDGTVARKK